MSTLVETGDRRISAVRTSPWWKVARELGYLVAFAYLYELIRGLMVQSGAVATKHARWVIDAEEYLGILWERSIQAVFLPYDAVVQFFNLYYGGTHFLVPAAVLIGVAVRYPEHYPRTRTLLAVTTAIGFACFALFPVAPPRLMPDQLGIVDTIRHSHGLRAASTLMDRSGNAYAAMPSLHLAWAVWPTVALYPLLRSRWTRIVAVAYPLMTALDVVVTGNHYILDCVAGAALVFVAAWLIRLVEQRIALRRA